jgi:pilus assembly protein CpaC
MMRVAGYSIPLLRLLLLFVGAASFASAAEAAIPRELTVAVSSAQVIEFPQPARSVFIADPSIADIQVSSPKSVIIFGRKPGSTTLIAIGNNEAPLAKIQVTVRYNIGDLRRLIEKEVPRANVTVEPTPTGIVLSGVVPNEETAHKVRVAAQSYLSGKEVIVNQLKVSGPAQVNLRVRVAEVSRAVTKQLGFSWEALVNPGSFVVGLATGSPFASPITGIIPRGGPLTNAAIPGSIASAVSTRRLSVNNLIDALAEEGVVKILAQPNLTALSGQPASFLAGGEFPVPSPQAGAGGATAVITIQFKEFGVKLNFVPTVLSNDRISIKVRPEVSELSDQGAITLPGNLVIPALTERTAETTVELGSGQSFAIAGLIQNNENTNITKFPWLGDLPVLGPLFRSSFFQRNETELVIIVTPYVVRPVDDETRLKLPTEGYTPTSEFERTILDRMFKVSPNAARALELGGARLHGDPGFIFQ